ncbi:hypothetical protein HDU97_001303 [Phlyctochytrium planicorne]|nr:hypothetical protein HDU97_001303 [Phlyctochytrium planicorne]
MKYGHVRIVLTSPVGVKSVLEYGDKESKLSTTVTVLKEAFWPRLMIYGALGFGEAYMYGEIEVDHLTDLLLIFIRNRDNFVEMNLLPSGLNKLINTIIHSPIPNTIYNSLNNIQAHYDLGNEMFSCFLDPTMTYSCPIWKTAAGKEDEDEIGDEKLEDAQMRKIRSILDMAAIREGDHVLEIGTGWGALAIEAVRRHKCKVTTLTLSKEQKALAEARIEAAGLSSHITVLLQDYRTLDPKQHRFDRIVTVEMLEAVGPEFLPVFFKQADALLDPHRGVLALQVITMPDSRYDAYLRKTDFIQKHIFPGGHCPSMTALVDGIMKGSKGRLVVDHVLNIGPHYAKALRLWRESFSENFDSVAEKTEDMRHVYTQEFKRKWEFYFAYCEAGFASRTLGDVQMRLTRERNLDLLDGIPF